MANTTGSSNTALGVSSLGSNTTGGSNTALGRQTLGSNTTGGANTAFGWKSLFNNTTGTQNTGLGYNARASAATATNQTVIGYEATGQADNSVVLGNSDVTAVYMAEDSGATVYAADAVFSGTITGDLTGDVTGDVTGTLTGDVTGNVTGDLTGDVTGNVTGNLTGDVTGTLTGYVTGDVTGTVSSISNHTTDGLTEGSTNLYFTDVRAQNAITVANAGGDGSLAYSGGTITYTGPNASDVQSYFSAGTGVSISSGTISIGQAVGTSNDVVFNNVTSDLTGDVTGNIAGASGYFNSLSGDIISDGTAILSSGSLSGVTDIVTTGNITAGGDLTVLSDARLKANIVSLGSTLSKLLLIDGKSYTMKNDNKQKIGVLAQDIEKVFPELVSETDGIKSVNYLGLVPVLINALKEQEQRLERLEQIVAQLD
mgnify:CR=1 FL=1